MAVTFDTSAATLTSTGGTTVSFSYTVTGANPAIIAGVVASGAAATITAARYAGASMDLEATASGGTSPNMWSKGQCATGSNTLAFDLSSYGILFVAVGSFAGVSVADPFGTPVLVNGNSSAPSSGSVTCPAGGMVWGFEKSNYTDAPAPTIGGGDSGTLAGSHRGGGGQETVSGAYRSSTGAVAWTLGSANLWSVIAIPINAEGGGSSAGAARNYYSNLCSE